MTEMGHGSDVASIETTLTYDPETDEIIVDSPTPSATKTYIGNAALHGNVGGGVRAACGSAGSARACTAWSCRSGR